jgi:diaminopimelate epimerase
MGRVKAPVKITCASGDVIEVNYTLSGETAVDVTMLGPAAYVFTGELKY